MSLVNSPVNKVAWLALILASCCQQSFAQNIRTESNPLDFNENATLSAIDDSYEILKDFHNYNTGLLIKRNVNVLRQLQFGGALNTSEGLPVEDVVENLGINTQKLGAMLLVDSGKRLDIGGWLGFSKQCTTDTNGGGDNPSKECIAAREDVGEIGTVSNDYLGVDGALIVGDYFRSWGGNDVLYMGANALVSVANEMDLGKGDDQVRMEYGSSLDVQSDLILGDGKDKFISRGFTSIKGDLYTGGGDDYIEIRGESPVGYGKIIITGKVDLGEGNDLFLLKNPVKEEFSLINKQLSLGAGDDVVDIRLKDTRLLIGKASDAENKNYSLNFGLGNDTLMNKGTLESGWGIIFDGGDTGMGDYIYNYEGGIIASYAGISFQDSGRGTIDNQGTIEVALENPSGRQIVFGLGNDRIINRKGGVVHVKGVIEMGDGNDLILNDGSLILKQDFNGRSGLDMGNGDDQFLIGNGILILTNGDKVNGGAGVDDLVLSDQDNANPVSFGTDASQQPSFGRKLIVAPGLSSQYVNFENLIQDKGNYEYQGDFSKDFDRAIVRDGVFVVRESSPATFENLELKDGGTIVVGMVNTSEGEVDRAPIVVLSGDELGGFIYSGGDFVISADRQNDPIGTFFVVDGNVVNAEALAKNSSIVYDCNLDNSQCTQQQFSGLGPANGIDASLQDVFLKEGSLQLVVDVKTSDDIDCDLYPSREECNQEAPDLPDPGLDPDLPGPIPSSDPLPGCDVGNDLCDVISDIPGDDDDAEDKEEEVSADVIHGVVDGLIHGDIKLPLMNYATLAKLVASGLLPRNVDAAGRGLFNYNNLLVDTVFDRQLLRQFMPVDVSEVVEEEEVEVILVEPAVQEPVRGLWSKTEALDDAEVGQYLDQQVAQNDGSQPSDQAVVVVDDRRIEMDGEFYTENPSLASEYAEPEGVRAWFRGFGGTSGATKTSTLYNNYNLSGGGGTLGVDVSLTSTISVGAFANYGNVSVNQYSGDTGGGGWNSDGWGGGVHAAWWTENFYVQGMFAGSSFSGSQSRNIVSITDDLGDETARGEKSATSYATALRIGAPFEAGGMLMEPQFTAAWTQNQENSFSENGANNLNLRYGSRTTNYLQTELGMKFSWPINSGETGLWVPSVRLAWLGDWDQNNESQSIGYNFTDRRVDVPSYEQDQNGLLVEGGLDYTLAKMNAGSWKVYVRGGAEVWGGERGTDWRGSGGVTWQF